MTHSISLQAPSRADFGTKQIIRKDDRGTPVKDKKDGAPEDAEWSRVPAKGNRK